MVMANEDNTAENNKKAKVANLKKNAKRAIYAVILGGIAYGLWQNPQLVEKIRSTLEAPASENIAVLAPVESHNHNELIALRDEVYNLKLELNRLQNIQNQVVDTAELDDKFANLEKTNMNIIDSKADVATVLGLINRMDKVEQNLDLISKVTDDGALVLTAVMMVKDSADRGGSFVYEAAVLQQLTEGNVKMKEPVEKIIKTASEGIKSDAYLIKQFDSVYTKLMKIQREEYEKTWKDRVNNKINQYIKIKKVNESSSEFKANQQLEKIKMLVDTGNIEKALLNLENINNKVLLDEESLQNWMAEASAKTEFSQAVAQISTYYIAALKVNFIKKETKND